MITLCDFITSADDALGNVLTGPHFVALIHLLRLIRLIVTLWQALPHGDEPRASGEAVASETTRPRRRLAPTRGVADHGEIDVDQDTVGAPGQAHPLMIMCPECGAVFGTGITLAPGASLQGSGNVTACPSCRSIVDIPDGEYGVVDGAVRWLRQFRTPDQRAHLAEVLQEAGHRLRQGEAAELVAEQIEQATGLRVWGFLVSAKGAALAGWISVVLTLLAYLNQSDPPPAATPPPPVNITVNMPPAQEQAPSVQEDPSEGDGGSGQRKHPDSLPPTSLGDVGDQYEHPAAGHQGEG